VPVTHDIRHVRLVSVDEGSHRATRYRKRFHSVLRHEKFTGAIKILASLGDPPAVYSIVSVGNPLSLWDLSFYGGFWLAAVQTKTGAMINKIGPY
jgi:hypothetical protein